MIHMPFFQLVQNGRNVHDLIDRRLIDLKLGEEVWATETTVSREIRMGERRGSWSEP